MATRDYFFPLKEKSKIVECENATGLNLNQNQQNLIANSILSKIVMNNELKLYKESNKTCSRLSLHITAYENSNEGIFSGSFDTEQAKTFKYVKERKNTKFIFAGLASDVIQNPYEFPRQQKEDQITEPEMLQFRASQRLLNPNHAQTEKDQFYISLDEDQKQMFKKFEQQQNDAIKAAEERHNIELMEAELALHDKEEECQELTAKLAEFCVDKEQRPVLKRGAEYIQTLKKDLLSVGVDLQNENQHVITINNFIYYRILKLVPEPYLRRRRILKLLGFSCHDNDVAILSTNFLFKFDQKFIKTRGEASRKTKLSNFDSQIIEFPKEQLPFIPPTVIESSSEIINSGNSEITVMEDMRMQIGEPLSKKSRIEISPVNNLTQIHPSINASTQTDLKLKNVLELEETKRKFKKMNQQITYHKGMSGSLKEKNKEYEALIADLERESGELYETYDELQALQKEIEKLNKEIQANHATILGLNDELENQKTINKFFLKNKSGNFTVEAHTCFSRLMSQGDVAQSKVGIVILVIADLFKIEVDAVPSRWTVGRDIHMIQSLNCEYIAKLIKECSNFSMLSDETTKFTKKIQAFVLSAINKATGKRFYLWIAATEVPTKSAERCLQEFQEVLSNIAKIGGFDVEKFVDNVVINIRNLMGDQAATTKLVYKLFITLRAFRLENSGFDDKTKESLKRVNTFFCMLHILSNSSAIVFKALLDHEKFCTENEEITEATVMWVLNEVARYFSKRSSGKHSTAAQWETLAKAIELKFSKIDSNLGHRFIIRFKIASEIVHNREEIVAFLEHLGNADETLINLKNALKNDMIILHLHVLALLGTLILYPMWQLCEASESILQMSLYAPALINYLKELVNDPMLLFTVTSPFDAFPGAAPKENSKSSAFLQSLKEHPIPVGGSEAVPIVAKDLLEYFEKQLEPFITGIYASPDIALEKETAGAPLTNMACESAFGFMDRLFTTKPNMTTYNRSALMIASKNNLFENITKLPEAEQLEMYEKAYGNKQLSAKLAAEKAQQIHRENVEKIEQQALKQQLEKQSKEAKRKKIAVDLRVCGFWLTVPEMEEALQNIPQSTAIKYVKANIRFRKAVWTPKFQPKNLLQFSFEKHKYTYSELVANLTAVIVADFSRQNPDTNNTSDSEED